MCVAAVCVQGFKGKTTVADAAGGDSVVAEPRSKRRAAKKEFTPDQKLLGLRKLFDSVTPGQNLDAYIVPSEDAHQVHHLCGKQNLSSCDLFDVSLRIFFQGLSCLLFLCQLGLQYEDEMHDVSLFRIRVLQVDAHVELAP